MMQFSMPRNLFLSHDLYSRDAKKSLKSMDEDQLVT